MFACDGDNVNLMQAALGDSDGVTAILGTGICAWAQIGSKTYRTSGWGYLVNEGGCAFDIGQDALNASLLTLSFTESPETAQGICLLLQPGVLISAMS